MIEVTNYCICHPGQKERNTSGQLGFHHLLGPLIKSGFRHPGKEEIEHDLLTSAIIGGF